MERTRKKTILTVSVIISIILLISVTLVALVLIRLDRPAIAVKRLEFTSFDTDRKGFVMDITLVIENPNPIALKVIRVTGEIFLDGTLVGDLQNRSGQSIAGHSSSELVISVHIDDPQMDLYKGKDLYAKGRFLGKYLFLKSESPFNETTNLRSNNGGPGGPSPNAVITGPLHATVMEEVQFMGSDSYDTGGQITSYSWDLGDGSTADTPDIAHRYKRTGVFMVKLVVVDDEGGSDTVFHEIAVTFF